MDWTMMLGIGLLVVGFLWMQKGGKGAIDPAILDLINQIKGQGNSPSPSPSPLAPQEPVKNASVQRQEALDAVDLLFKYFEQQGVAGASEPLQKLISLLFTPKV